MYKYGGGPQRLVHYQIRTNYYYYYASDYPLSALLFQLHLIKILCRWNLIIFSEYLRHRKKWQSAVERNRALGLGVACVSRRKGPLPVEFLGCPSNLEDGQGYWLRRREEEDSGNLSSQRRQHFIFKWSTTTEDGRSSCFNSFRIQKYAQLDVTGECLYSCFF